MNGYPEPLQDLIDGLGRLPGIGTRSAERLAFYLLKAEPKEALTLASLIQNLKAALVPCRECFNFSDQPICPICSDPDRDRSVIMVVESPKDLIAFERTNRFNGLYHVLMGHVSPHEGSALKHLTTDQLIRRATHSPNEPGVKEIILATSPDAEGDGTALELQHRLASSGVAVTRLARGLPSGLSIEYAGTEVLADALSGRRPARREAE